jgi:eukaryotic-like serine/threonine-protein kinase
VAGSISPNPAKLQDFQVLKRLGAGGMAEVFLARKAGAEGTFKLLVVKRILPSYGTSRRFKSMFVQEAQLATRLNHPNIVQVYDFFDAGDEGHCLSMEYVEGVDLGVLVAACRAQGRTLDPWLSAWVIAEAARGLHYAHERKDERGQSLEIVHRDVSPQNILLSFEGAVKLTDFGIASGRLSEHQEGSIKGKFGYMSPEQARGERVDRRSDLYSLGVMFWELLTSRALHGPLGGEALLDMVRRGEVEPPSVYVPSLPQDLESVVMKLLQHGRDGRYGTARELASDLARILLRHQKLIDGADLEAALLDLTPPSKKGDPAPQEITNPDVPHPRTHRPGTSEPQAEPTAVEPREVRHVVLCSIRLFSTEGVPNGPLPRKVEAIRRMIAEIGYKRGIRFFWTSDREGRAIGGLAAKHSRAALDAALLALEIHEAIVGYDENVGVRAGISMVRGLASGFRDRDGNLVRFVLHDPGPQLAAIMQRDIREEETRVAGAVYRLLKGEFEWLPQREISLTDEPDQGVALPSYMHLHTIVRRLTEEERSGAQIILGREAELAELASGLHHATRATKEISTTRIVVGELGIGKTALVNAFCEDVAKQKVRILRLECTPVSTEVPFGTAAELIRELISANGTEPFEELARRIGALGGGSARGDQQSPMVARLAELASTARRALTREDEAIDQKRLTVSAFRNLLAALALDCPVVLVLDGFQWIDRASAELFLEVLRASDPIPLLGILVTRPEDRVAPFLEDRLMIRLEPLPESDLVAICENRLGVREGVLDVCTQLMPRAGGNPFFLLEMIEALLERGVLEIRDNPVPVLARKAGGELGYQLPFTIEQLVADRIGELPREERAIVEWLSIAGGPLRKAEVCELATLLGEEAIGRICARGICETRGELVDFRHPLTRQVAYTALAPEVRSRMHAELGDLLKSQPASRGLQAAVVARHFAHGNDDHKAADAYLEAAWAARAAHQLPLAAKYLRRALTHLQQTDRRIDVALEGLESIYRALGRRTERISALNNLRRRAHESGSGKLAALALLRVARLHLDEMALAKGLPIAQAAARIAEQCAYRQLSVEAEAITSEFLRELGDVQGALAACDRALASYGGERPKTGRTYAEVLRARGVLLRRVGRVREAVDAYAEALAVAKVCGARRLEARTKNALAYAMFVQGRYEDAIALAQDSIGLDLSMGGRFQVAKTLTNIGHAYARLGDFSRAKAYLGRAKEAHERYGDQDGWVDTLLVSAEVALECDEVELAERYLIEAATRIVSSQSAYDATHLKLVQACMLRCKRESKQAIQSALEGRRAAESQALVSYSLYGTALEAAARVDAGEIHAGTLLATTALGAVETLQGCEYGLEIRTLCADALKRSGSPQAKHALQLAVEYAGAMIEAIREQRLRQSFQNRPAVASLFETTPVPAMLAPGS